mmetsp:Transcript_5906/g.11382  ORF Transcript_5906/g.11382 Transcript_5906/m.11382 type:complete len:335 (-) Transcript_5906:401-1405(-)
MESLGSCAAWRQPLPRRLMAAALLVSAAAEAPLLQRPAEARAAAPTGAAQQLPRAAMTSIAPSRRAMELHQQSSDANGACDVDCLVHGQHAICAFRVMWALNHRFKNKPCSAALDMVKAQCPVCLSCTLETLTAKGACSAGALPSTTTLPPAVPVPTPAETAVPAPVPDRYDCMKELFNWQKVWDDAKKQWCCTHRSRGCAADTTASPGRAYSCEIGRGGAANSVQVWSKKPDSMVLQTQRRSLSTYDPTESGGVRGSFWKTTARNGTQCCALHTAAGPTGRSAEALRCATNTRASCQRTVLRSSYRSRGNAFSLLWGQLFEPVVGEEMPTVCE